ncbi:MAG: UPF0365 family protein, partial [Amphibacillus sp.]|nr:UPF0365 family protein [Amphibacillus sp.]
MLAQSMNDLEFLFPMIIIGLIVIAIIVILTFIPVALWISALAAGVRVGIFTLIGM